MTRTFHRFLTAAFVLLIGLSGTAYAESQTMTNALDPKQQSIVRISSASAVGDLDGLKTALTGGLEAGLTVNEIKELLVQVYAYAGFPRSLNALSTFQTVMNERAEQGIKDEPGPEPSPAPTDRTSLEFGTENQTRLVGRPIGGGIYDFAPAIDQFLKAHLFGDIFQRDNLDWKSRELATIAILASIDGLEPQLRGHIAIGMHNGLTEDQIKAAAAVLGETRGEASVERVRAQLKQATSQQN